jgi:hypothetical protein
MSGAQLDIGLISCDPTMTARIEALCAEYGYSLICWPSIELFASAASFPRLVIATSQVTEGTLLPAELAQMVRFSTSESRLLCTTKKIMSKDEVHGTKKSGADIVLLDDEVFNTCKIDFILTQTLKSSYLPIKPSELAPNQILGFDLFHLMPQRQKFLRIVRSTDSVSAAQIEKFNIVGEFYMERSCAPAFSAYIKATTDASKSGLAKRCRSQFLALFSGFSDLAIELTNQSDHASLGDGQLLLKNTTTLCATLLETLAEFGNAWGVVNNSAIGELGSVERAPAIAAYAGLFGLRLGFPSIENLMLAALLSELGLIFVGPGILKKLREYGLSALDATESAAYRNYPEKSLSILLDRKIAVPAQLRTILVATQEREDGLGFPKGLSGAKLPPEARLISFCRELDQLTMIRMGRERMNVPRAVKSCGKDSADFNNRFPAEWIQCLESIAKD